MRELTAYPSAVAAIIDHLELEPHEHRKTEDGTRYATSAIPKVENWLRKNDFPEEITVGNDGFALHVAYATKGESDTT